jgi:hypothetical protein
MAAIDNPYTVEARDLINQIAALEAQARDLRNSEASWYQRYQAWGPGTPEGDESLAKARALSSQAAELDTRIAGLKVQLEAARKNEAQFAAAQASAIAQGMTPEAAALKAQTDMDRAALVNKIIKGVAIALGVLAVGYGIVVFIRWKKKSK